MRRVSSARSFRKSGSFRGISTSSRNVRIPCIVGSPAAYIRHRRITAMFAAHAQSAPNRQYYLLLSLLITPVHALQWGLAALLLPMEAIGYPLSLVIDIGVLGFPSIVCCLLHWGLKRAPLLSWGSLWVCGLLPLLAGGITAVGFIAWSTSESMAGIVVLLSLIANMLCSLLFVSLFAWGRAWKAGTTPQKKQP